MRNPLKHFLKRISPEPNSGCWLWDGRTDKDGYGQFAVADGKGGAIGWPAHRYSWAHYRGPIPRGLQVCHKCDVRPCVNPDHLFLGTTQDNTADRTRKGRSARGEQDGNSKLTAEDVRAIRADTRTQDEIAAAWRICRQNVWFIRARWTWKHI